jgi:hypothetical protein
MNAGVRTKEEFCFCPGARLQADVQVRENAFALIGGKRDRIAKRSS